MFLESRHHFVRGRDEREKIRLTYRDTPLNAVHAQKLRVFNKKKDSKNHGFVW